MEFKLHVGGFKEESEREGRGVKFLYIIQNELLQIKKMSKFLYM